MTDVIEAEIGQELEVRGGVAPVTLFGTDDPVAVIEKASAVARALADVIEKQNLYSMISGKKHIKVEGWTLLGSMLGVFPETEWTRRVTDTKGAEAYEARVVARTRDGAVVGAREAMCSRSEARWKNADDYALRSMAQTRAVSGALAAPLRFIVVLAGYEGTPEAEMPPAGHTAAPERRVDTTERVKVPRSWEDVMSLTKELLGADDAMEWLTQAKELKEMGAIEANPTLLQRLAGAAVDLAEMGHDYAFLTDSRTVVQAVYAARLDGSLLDGPEWALTGAEAEAGRAAKADVLAARAAL